MSKRLSIVEVARRANCSIASVSNVLNNKGRVSEAKREEILKVVKSLGYHINSAGRNLRTQRTETLGLLFFPTCAEIFRNPFYAEVMEGLEGRLTKEGYHLLLAGYEASTTNSVLPSFLQKGKVDGTILLGRFPSPIIRDFRDTQTPLLLLDTNAEWAVDSVVSDGFSGGVMMVNHLAANGHQNIVMVAYDWEDYNIDLRVQGFLAGLDVNGLRKSKGSVIRNALSHDTLYPALKKKFSGANPPTAIVCVNDTLAMAMKERMEADGIRVPDDICVVGYDDEPFAEKAGLTTVRVDRLELGRVGAELMLKRVNSPDSPVNKVRLPVELVLRDSVRTVPSGKGK